MRRHKIHKADEKMQYYVFLIEICLMLFSILLESPKRKATFVAS